MKRLLHMILLITIALSLAILPIPAESPQAKASEEQPDQVYVAFTDDQLGFSFLHPTDVVVRQWSPTHDIISSLGLYPARAEPDDEEEHIPEVAISVLDNPEQLIIDQWVDAHSLSQDEGRVGSFEDSAAIFFYSLGIKKSLSIQDRRAVLLFENTGQSVGIRVLIPTSVGIISVALTDPNDAGMRDIFAVAVSSLSFLDERRGPFVDHGLRSRLLAEASQARSIDESRLDPAQITTTSTGYRLPWTTGATFTVTQGWGDSYSHTGEQHYAYDFNMGEGTSVRAAKGGTVRNVENRYSASTCGGYDYRNLANRLTIDHDDGTATLYLHLQRVDVTGGTVGQGALIGLSGKTGWTNCNPHLHFQRQAQGEWFTQSQAIYFDEYPGQQLIEGQTYTSQNGGPPGGSCNTGVPSLTSPQNGHTVDTNQSITFNWSSVSGCSRYRFEAWNDSASGVGRWVDVDGTSYTFTPGSAGSWRWQVRIIRSDGTHGDAPPTRSFTVTSAPPPPTCSPNSDQVTLYANTDYGGSCVTLGVGDYPNPETLGSLGNDNAESIRVGGNVQALLYEHDNYQGRSETFTGDDSRLWDNNIGANSVSSVKVQRRPSASGTWTANYFRKNDLSELVFRQDEPGPYLFRDWETGSPRGDVPADNFSVEWSGNFHFDGGDYTFFAKHDDGAVVCIDGCGVGGTIINQWNGGWEGQVIKNLSSGNHHVIVQFREFGGNAHIDFWWEGPGQTRPHESQVPDRWIAHYFPNKRLDSPPMVSVNDVLDTINHDWSDGSPGWSLPNDRFSVRFEKSILFDCGTYRFTMAYDDGLRLFVDEAKQYEDWQDGSHSGRTVDLPLSSGTHDLRVEYYENSGEANISLSWQRIAGCVPPAPQLSSPSDASVFTEGTAIEFVWTGTGMEYLLEVIGGPAGAQSYGWGSETSLTVTDLSAGYSYTWHVKSRNADGESDWSESREFSINLGAPTLDPVGDQAVEAGATLDVTITASDPNGDPIGLSATGLPAFATLTDHGDGTATLHLAPSAADVGTHSNITITATDGSLSDSETITITVDQAAVDTTAPTTSAPLIDITATTLPNSTTAVPVTLTWSGQDEVGGSGLAGFDLEQSTDGGTTWTRLFTNTSQTTHAMNLAAGTVYQFRVRADDVAENLGEWTTGGPISASMLQESAPTVSYAGTWGSSSYSWALGNRVSSANRSGQSATVRFIGQEIALIAPTNRYYGQIRVYADDALIETVDLYSASFAARQVVFRHQFETSASHTLRIEVTGTRSNSTANGTWFFFDAVVVLGAPTRDTTAPIANAPTVNITASSLPNSVASVPVTVSWSGQDEPSGSGILGFDLERSNNDGATWTRLLSSSTQTSHSLAQQVGSPVHLRVRSIDVAGNVGEWVTSEPTEATMLQETAPTITYTGNWGTVDYPWALGGGVFSASRSGQAATVQFIGQEIALVAPTNRYYGQIKVYADDALIETVDLYSANFAARQVVFHHRFDTAESHLLRIEVTGTRSNSLASGTWFFLDAVVVLGAPSSDVTPPLPSTPMLGITATSVQNSTTSVPITLSWSSQDETGGSGIAGFDLEQSTNGGASWIRLFTGTSQNSHSMSLAIGSTYQFRIRASDLAGNMSEWTTSDPISPAMFQESDASVEYVGSWTTGSYAWALANGATFARQSGDSATLSVVAREIAVIAPMNRFYGTVEIYIDDTLVETIDLYRASFAARQVVFHHQFATVGNHTIRIEVTGSSNPAASASYAFLDAFVVLN